MNHDDSGNTHNSVPSGPTSASSDDVKGCLGCLAILIATAMTGVIVSGLIRLASWWWQ